MLNSCGRALSQGDGSDFNPGCNWEAPPPHTHTHWLQSPCKRLEMIDSTSQGHICPDLLWQPSKTGRIRECWQLWPIVGGMGNGVAEEDWHWDLNPGMAAMQRLFGTVRLGQRRTRHLFGTMRLGQRSTDFYFFFWDMVPQTAQRRKEGLCVCGYSKGLWDLNEDIKSLLLSLYNSLKK